MTDAETFLAGEKRVHETGNSWRQPAMTVSWEFNPIDFSMYMLVEFPDQSRISIINGEARID
jgi:hypothetical protein